MGICLDTEQNNEELETTGGERSRSASAWAGRATPPAGGFPMQNSSHVKFEPPNVPVIFVLGGPGSGKVTHCDNLMQERRGLVHINMTDLLQQYAIGNDMQDFGTLSSKTVTEVLMLEMKMAPTAKTYLVSGYPRSMRDVAEYSDKIQTINGVVLVSWRQRVLERQIEYGARLGHVVLSLARMELNNFYKHVMPVADYFDQSNMLIAVNGERNPEEVYKDFRTAVLQILGSTGDQSSMNGVSGVGVGAGGIPGEIVGIEPAPEEHTRDEGREGPERREETIPHVVSGPAPIVSNEDRREVYSPKIYKAKCVQDEAEATFQLDQIDRTLKDGNVKSTRNRRACMKRLMNVDEAKETEIIRVSGATTTPPLLWVVGGPGSNKAALCQQAVGQRQGWMHFSVGQQVRALAEAGGGAGSEGGQCRAALAAGELAPAGLAAALAGRALQRASRAGHGLLLDSYPRDLDQMTSFQEEFKVSPRMVLLDCSKLQLGRGRRDDSVAAFRRRLEVFRELSLPMLKTLDQDHRLVIVDGDTDSAEVQAEFTRVLLEEMEKAELIASGPDENTERPPAPRTDISSVQQFAHAMSRMGGALANGHANGALPNGTLPNGTMPNGTLHNGALPNGIGGLANNKIRPMGNVAKIPTVSEMTHNDVRRMYEQSSGEITMDSHM